MKSNSYTTFGNDPWFSHEPAYRRAGSWMLLFEAGSWSAEIFISEFAFPDNIL